MSAPALPVLLLAGTAEGRRLARLLAAEPGIAATASLAGATASPRPLALPTRRGGFGGAAGLERHLADGGIRAVIDATHPYAAVIKRHVTQAARARGLPRLHLLRPPWRPPAGARWIERPDLAAAAAAIPAGARVLAALGSRHLAGIEALSHATVHLRVLPPAPGPFPLPHGGWVAAPPGADMATEVALFRRLGITHLLCRNAGGAAGWPKIAAAHALGIPVVMIARPPPPEGPSVATVEAALDWIRALRDAKARGLPEPR